MAPGGFSSSGRPCLFQEARFGNRPHVKEKERLMLKLNRLYDRIRAFFAGWQFPVILLSILIFYALANLAVLLLPTTGSSLSSFAEDFKIWCFGYDPATGELEVIYIFMNIFNPLLLCSIILLVWGGSIKEALAKGIRQVLPWVGTGFAIVATLVLTLVFLFDPARPTEGELPFPAEGLRTSLNPPDFTLINQNGDTISLKDFRGEVVLITAVYATCGSTCPMILDQAKRALTALTPEETESLKILAITLDPETDTPEMLKILEKGQKVSAPLVNFLTGEPDYVNDVLDRLNVARTRDPKTGIISHANLFLLVDRKGKLAYRFTLGERQENWLIEALKLLIQEENTPS